MYSSAQSVSGKDETAKSENVNENVAKAVLIREKTCERIAITKQVFKIGKEREFVDYCIRDNPTISRSHANIVIEDKEYYIMDINSKNHTFVNERMNSGSGKKKTAFRQ